MPDPPSFERFQEFAWRPTRSWLLAQGSKSEVWRGFRERTDIVYKKSLNSSQLDECLSTHRLEDMDDVWAKLQAWQGDDNMN